MTSPTYEKKQCSTCHAVKLLSEFYSDRSRPDGRNTRCKDCVREARRNSRTASSTPTPAPIHSEETFSEETPMDQSNEAKLTGYYASMSDEDTLRGALKKERDRVITLTLFIKELTDMLAGYQQDILDSILED